MLVPIQLAQGDCSIPIILGADSFSFFSSIVLFKKQPSSLDFWRLSRKIRISGKNGEGSLRIMTCGVVHCELFCTRAELPHLFSWS